jgi:hypothetical protein
MTECPLTADREYSEITLTEDFGNLPTDHTAGNVEEFLPLRREEYPVPAWILEVSTFFIKYSMVGARLL